MTEVVVRFAPSPSGFLHLGHGFSAVLGHHLARELGGKWIVRVEDIDTTRCKPVFTAAILEDLNWLGLIPDGPILIQTEQRQHHQQALERLGAMGVTYPCFCTRADIAQAAGAPHGMPPAYPGTCRHIPPQEASIRARSEPHAVRLNVAKASKMAGPLTWQDHLNGVQIADPLVGGDIVLARKDIGIGYALAAVVDDAHQGVTHVVRGRDLLEATPSQRLLQTLLSLPSPSYLHHRLLLASDGRRLAKRHHAATMAELRKTGKNGLNLAKKLKKIPPNGPDLYVPVSP